jgi:stage II sporulation protein D
MLRVKIFFLLLLAGLPTLLSAQVRVRLFANQFPESAVFSVTSGAYDVDLGNGAVFQAEKGEPVIIIKYNGKIAVKLRNGNSLSCDSLLFRGKSGNDIFSLRMSQKFSVKQNYSGDLSCYPDFGTLLFVNTTDFEKYISGVVMAEGGAGKSLEFYKAQAIIARTYMYKYFDRHSSDGYNLCDNTHCQAFNGLTTDSVIALATTETRGMVILDKDSVLIMAAFHSNCGGETSSSQDVWLSYQPYLKSISDPYCTSSRNATWQKSISLNEWEHYLQKSAGNNMVNDTTSMNFIQNSRMTDYRSGPVRIPLTTIRSDFNLRSTFFSVYKTGDSVLLRGRGYGHGVGLCQEGAMTMAARGFKFPEIIKYYYSGVIISDIKDVRLLPANPVWGAR